MTQRPDRPDRTARENASAGRIERAFTLYCQGRRTGAIASEMGVSSSTVRRWVRERLRALAGEERAEHAHHLLRAIESQRAIASAAWSAYERECLDPEPGVTGQCARYLSIASAAQREVARLEGLYARVGEPEGAVRVTITRRPDGPENMPPQSSSESGKP
jgi:transposase-like protein